MGGSIKGGIRRDLGVDQAGSSEGGRGAVMMVGMSWIQTFTGRKFYPLDPRAADVDVRDIAHALAMKCRFGGHCRAFYSVAQHSVLVSQAVRAEHALWGLMHDAAEAYLADVGRPVKAAMRVACGEGVETFDALEERVLAAVAAGLGFPAIAYEAVAEADLVLLATEARDLMAEPPEDWELGVEALAERIVPVGPEEAEGMFLRRWEELRGSEK